MKLLIMNLFPANSYVHLLRWNLFSNTVSLIFCPDVRDHDAGQQTKLQFYVL
jgi:hypothetical protein